MKALITGICGQDGSYLAERLLECGYEVHGIIRRSSSFNTARIDHLIPQDRATSAELDRIKLWHGDVTDSGSIDSVIRAVEPDEIYNLAAQSHVHVSFKVPGHSVESVYSGLLHVLEAVRRLPRSIREHVRVYQASSSEMFGGLGDIPQSESTPFNPRSPYAAAKVFAHHIAKNYRDAYGLFVVCGILFNHTSERRGETFVCRKVTRAVGRIEVGLQKELVLGRLDPKRDWGYAPDYVRAMHMMVQHKAPEDFVIGTGETHSVQELCELAFAVVGRDWRRYVRQDDRYNRPTEVDVLIADSTRARTVLGWQPSLRFAEIVRKMVLHDIELAKREKRADAAA